MYFWKKLSTAKKIILYGTGEYGKAFKKWMSIVRKDDSLEIIPAVSEIKGLDDSWLIGDAIRAHYGEAIIVVAASEEKSKEMIAVLKGLNIDDYIYISSSIYRFMKYDYENQNTLSFTNDYSNAIEMELVWANVLDRLIYQKEWIIQKDLTTVVSSAVDNHYMYILLKALDSKLFNNILDIGMGQTTKIFAQYMEWRDDVKLSVVENDVDWINFSMATYLKDWSRIDVFQMDYEVGSLNNIEYRRYNHFKDVLCGKRYGIISIDAPLGTDMDIYSRRDILDILPDCLDDNWIILIHDTQRVGERETVWEIEQCLIKNKIDYAIARYCNLRGFTILTDKHNKFFCTI